MLYMANWLKIRLVVRFLQVNEYIRWCNDTLLKTNDTPFKTKPSENHTLSDRTFPLRLYKGGEYPLPGNCITHVSLWLPQVRREVDEFYRPYFTTDETRYTELVIVVDNKLVR